MKTNQDQKSDWGFIPDSDLWEIDTSDWNVDLSKSWDIDPIDWKIDLTDWKFENP